MEELMLDDIEEFKRLLEDFKTLQDTDYHGAYELHKRALGLYDRWSEILFNIRKADSSKKNAYIKDRVKHILEIIDNVYISSRMVWNKAKDDIEGGKYEKC